jgi:prepilin-type N-terminal cleavage/methylation domain-containing protein
MSATRCSTSQTPDGQTPDGLAAGFSILEMLVVLIIVGLVTSSMFEAMSRLNDVRGRLSPFLADSERIGLMNSWFRTAVNDIVPDQQNGKNIFKGAAHSFSGLTLGPLSGDPGAPSPFQWELVYDSQHDRTVLRYTGFDKNPIEVRGWHGDKTAFAYLAPDLTWSETWPPGILKSKQLPLAIRLYAPEEGATIVAAIRGEKDMPPDPAALFLGRGTPQDPTQ